MQPRHLHYTDVMPLLCHVWFCLGLGLGLEQHTESWIQTWPFLKRSAELMLSLQSWWP